MTVRDLTIRGLPVILAFVGCVFVVAMIASSPRTVAQAAQPCHAAMIFDRSGSVGSRNLETMRQQVLRLFQPPKWTPQNPNGGLYNDNIKLAFWSFSSNNGRSNYNAPFNGYVSSRGVDNNFWTNLNRMVSSGSTNYEQGFGFHNGTMNSFDNMTSIINQADIIVFMTDGLPNVPGIGDNNSQARAAGRNAVLKHKAAGRIVIGGLVGNLNGGSLNYVINGSDSNASNTFRISSDYSDLSRKLNEVIGTKCSELFPPEEPPEYSLRPIVTSDDRVLSGTGSATFTYSVTNNSSTDSSEPTDWSIARIVVPRDRSASKLYFGNDTYRDEYSCEQLELLINADTCEENISSGRQVFGPGVNPLTVGSRASNLAINDQWDVGTTVCYFLTIAKPTHKATPTNRFSEAACTTVGVRPFIQVHGGDLLAGRKFANDPPKTQPSMIMTSITPKNDGKTYGSWAEYGVFASGSIEDFASQSGLAGGSFSEAQATWSDLTFANTNNEFGQFTKVNCDAAANMDCDMDAEENGSLGTMPDTVGAILAGRNVVNGGDLSGETSKAFNGNVTEGLYRKPKDNLILKESLLNKGKTIILDVPQGTVTISGDIKYFPGPYTNIREIPQLIIRAKRIVIESSVTHVDAWLIADHPDDGKIITCDKAVDEDGKVVSYVDSDTLTSEICNKPLQINGPVMARELILRRTGGAGRGGASGDPAETFNLRADAFLWSQNENRSAQRIQTTFTTELPPYF